MLTFTGFTVDSDDNKIYKEYFLDEAFLINCGPVLERMFHPDLKEEENDLQYLSYNEYLEEIIKLVSTGELDNKFLEMPRKQLRMIIDFYSLNFYCTILDYPDKILKEYFYSQWYRTNINNEKINNEFWTDNSRLIKIDSERIRTVLQANEIRANCRSYSLYGSFRIIPETFYKKYISNCERQFQGRSDRIVHKFNRNVYLMKQYTSCLKEDDSIFSRLFTNLEDGKANIEYCIRKLKEDFKDMIYSNRFVEPDMEKLKRIIGYKSVGHTNRNEDIFEHMYNFIFDGTVIIAGGFVIDSLNLNTSYKKESKNDVDFFFINGNDKNFEAKNLRKMKEIFEIMEVFRPSKNKSDYIRTSNSVTYKNIQFILRAYNSIEQVLMGFDIAASSVGFDGKDFFMTPLAEISLRNRVIIPFLDQYSTSTTYRICKYAKHKNFSIYIPGVKADNLNQYLGKGFRGVPAIANWHCSDVLPKSRSDYSYNVNVVREVDLDDYEQHVERIDNTYDKVVNNNGTVVKVKKNKDNIQRYFRGMIISSTYENLFMHFKGVKESFPLEWKMSNPGEQFTGSFEAMIYTNPSIWYNPEYKKEHLIDENYEEYKQLIQMIRDQNVDLIFNKMYNRRKLGERVEYDDFHSEYSQIISKFLTQNKFTSYQKLLVDTMLSGKDYKEYSTGMVDVLTTSRIKKVYPSVLNSIQLK